MIAKEISIDSNGIYSLSRNMSDTIITDIQTNTVIQCYPDGHESFWYKIRVKDDCEVTFQILPFGSENIYNFFLYQHNGDISPSEIKERNIAPIRANLCKNEMAIAGTGLSITSAVNFYDASSKTKVQDFYYTQYHAPVLAKKGDVLILNVYHIKGVDCGYQFVLNANKHSQKFKSVYKSCYTEQLKKSISKKTLNPSFSIKIPQFVKTNSVNEAPALPVATFITKDSAKRTIVEGEMARIVKNKTAGSKIPPAVKGQYQLALEKNTGYHLIFSSIGYKSLEVFFMTGDTAKSFTNDVYLLPCKEGDNFVMDKIYFYPNTYNMKPGSGSELDKLVTYLKANPGISIEIQGHTNGNNRIKASYESDFKGSSKKLSQYRADIIKNYLTGKEIEAERLSAIGYGGSNPIFPDPKNQTQANKNIRVEVLILSQKETALSSKTK
ncbi:MAG: OmpA family protein [Bacteroidetes bacterium]|nr:OmpA family protein [Bacteroidota bacterium]